MTATKKTVLEQVVAKVEKMSQPEAHAVVTAAKQRLNYGDALSHAVEILLETLNSGGGYVEDAEKGAVYSTRNEWFWGQVAIVRSLTYAINQRLSRISDELDPVNQELAEIFEKYGTTEQELRQNEVIWVKVVTLGSKQSTLQGEEAVLEALWDTVVAEASKKGHRTEYYRRQYIEDTRQQRAPQVDPSRQIDLSALAKSVGAKSA